MRFRLSPGGSFVSALIVAVAVAVPSARALAATAAVPTATGPDGIATVAVDAHPLTPPDAPADQYFGRLKLSNLGVRNIIHALSVEGQSPLALPLERTRIMGVETALAEWGDEYPRDTWLRGAMLSFAGVMAGKHDVDTDRLAVDFYLQTVLHYPNTRWSKQALHDLGSLTPATGIDWTVSPYDPPDMDMLKAQRIKL